VEIHRSARRHGVSDDDIEHVCAMPLAVADLDPDADPPEVLVVGPDRAGKLVEVIMLELANDRLLVIHAMALRPVFHHLLPEGAVTDGA
jgi:hypothetical protein